MSGASVSVEDWRLEWFWQGVDQRAWASVRYDHACHEWYGQMVVAQTLGLANRQWPGPTEAEVAA